MENMQGAELKYAEVRGFVGPTHQLLKVHSDCLSCPLIVGLEFSNLMVSPCPCTNGRIQTSDEREAKRCSSNMQWGCPAALQAISRDSKGSPEMVLAYPATMPA